MSLIIRGIGTAVPGTPVTQVEALACARELCGPAIRSASWLSGLYAHSGIQARYQVLGRPFLNDVLNSTRESGSVFLPDADRPDGPSTAERMRFYAEAASPLALTAAQRVLAEADIPAATITHLITVSCTGFAAPGVDWALIEGLGLGSGVERTHIGFMGCHGALNGLRVANAFATASPDARILLCAVELCSLHYHYGDDREKAVANAIFADGAAAVIGVGGDAGAAEWRVAATGSGWFPGTAEAMSWTIGDAGFEMTLSRGLPSLIAKTLRPWMEQWLRCNGLSIESVGSWAIHPGGPRILTAVEEGLGLSEEDLRVSREVYAGHGNMSSPTVLFILDRLRSMAAPRPCVALGFGPGLAAEAILLR